MTKKSRRRNHQSRDDDHNDANKNKKIDSQQNWGLSKDNLLMAATVAGIAYLSWPLLVGKQHHNNNNNYPRSPKPPPNLPNIHDVFAKSSAESVEERLLEEWQPGKSVTIQTIDNDNDDNNQNNNNNSNVTNRGLVATRDIAKGQVIARVAYPDLEAELVNEHPTLQKSVQKVLDRVIQQYDNDSRKWITLTTGKVMSLIQFLLEDSEGEDSIWFSFIETIPTNLTTMSWYWTEQERECIVPRPTGKSLQLDLQVYHDVMEEIRAIFEPLDEIYNRERVEWAYLMLKTRGFGQFFLPVLHLANHNPLEAVPAFLIPTQNTAVYVATHNIKAGEPIYTSYGSMMTPVVMAEQYGFVDPSTAYFEVPSILEDILVSDRTSKEPLCNADAVRFFGSVPTKTVGTAFQNAKHSIYFKSFMPDERSYACIRVLLQTERDTDVAGYIAEKLEIDYNRYKTMMDAPHCQSSEGNFPLIRKANLVMARMLNGALELAKQGRDWKIAYPDIPTYIMNNP